MKIGCKISWILNAILAVTLVGLVTMFVVGGATQPHADGRIVVLLSADERNKVLGEMRGLLETVKIVVEASVAGDMARVSQASTAAGMVAAEGESPALIGKLPLAFMRLGMGTHEGFDDLAETAASADDPMVVLDELSGLMNNCTACHADYRLGVEGADLGN